MLGCNVSNEDNATAKGLSSFTDPSVFSSSVSWGASSVIFLEAFPYVMRLQTAVSNHPIIVIHE